MKIQWSLHMRSFLLIKIFVTRVPPSHIIVLYQYLRILTTYNKVRHLLKLLLDFLHTPCSSVV